MTPLERYQQKARERYGRTTPFRLGFLVGEAGDNLPCPYAPHSRGAISYENGFNTGQRRRQIRQMVPSD